MSELVLSVFEGEESASAWLGELRAALPAIEAVESAGTVSVGRTGSYAVGTTGRPGSGSAFPGIFWEALFGLLFLVPTPGSSFGPGAGAVFGTLLNAGVDEGFLDRAREVLRPGTSAVALLLADGDREPVLGSLGSRGGTFVRTSLSAEQDAELERELGGASRPSPERPPHPGTSAPAA
jgi:uncharacterized membrane protein